MIKRKPIPMTLEEFASVHQIPISDTCDSKCKGYSIHTGVVSLPSAYFVTEDTFKTMNLSSKVG